MDPFLVVLLLVVGSLLLLWGWCMWRSRHRRASTPGTTQRPVARAATEAVTERLRPLLGRDDVLVIEVQGTGARSHPEAVAVAVIDTTGRVLLDTVSLPQESIQPQASQLHGLTRARLRRMNARPWPDVHAEVAELLQRAPVVIAWDGETARSLLEKTAARHHLELPTASWHSACRLDSPVASLPVVALRLGMTEIDGHGVLSEAQLVLAVLRRACGGARRG